VTRGIVVLTTSLRTLIIAFQVANAAGVFGAASIGVFLFGLMWLLAECGFLLVRLLFVRP
jgi:ABC-type transporter Mla maintaining outer membrane lipid asymmetry permease subunit MlaE